MAEFEVQSANNMPVQAPLIPDPVIPYSGDSITVYALCEVDPATIRRYLAPTPFTSVSNKCLIYVNDFSKSKQLPYMDAGIILQVKYRDLQGGYYIFEYEDNDAAIETGRSLWGYPKKYAEITLQREGCLVRGLAMRKGKPIIEIQCDLAAPMPPFEKMQVFPHLNLQTIPKAEGPGIWKQRVILRDNSMDCRLKSEEFGQVKVKVSGLPTDPLDEFTPTKIIGGGYTVVDFLAGEVNGWGKVLAELV
jgi:acetoacetate decarboxylase